MKKSRFLILWAYLALFIATANPVATAAAPNAYELISNTWYKGTLGGTSVWLYISYVSGEYCNAVYGYDSQKGAFLRLSGKINGDAITLEFSDYAQKPHIERFDGIINRSTGTINGTWTWEKKILAFELMPVTTSNPANNTEFLNAFSDVLLPFGYSEYNGPDIQDGEFKYYYADKKYTRSITNLSSFIAQIETAAGDAASAVAMEGNTGVLLCKQALTNGQWLVFFSADLALEEPVMINGTYEENAKAVLCAALLDAKGKCLQAVRLGNDGEDSYYTDFGVGMNTDNPNQIDLWWTFYMMDEGARIEDTIYNRTVRVVNGRLQLFEE